MPSTSGAWSTSRCWSRRCSNGCDGQLREFFDEIEVVLVDEYQDTNLMQEGLYFEMAKSATVPSRWSATTTRASTGSGVQPSSCSATSPAATKGHSAVSLRLSS